MKKIKFWLDTKDDSIESESLYEDDVTVDEIVSDLEEWANDLVSWGWYEE